MKKAIIIAISCIAALFISAIVVSSIQKSQVDKLWEKYRNTGLQYAQIEIIYHQYHHDIYATETYIIEHYN